MNKKDKKDIHIVFGGAGVLKRAKKNTVRIINLKDALVFGPLCDINSADEIKKRCDWFYDVGFIIDKEYGEGCYYINDDVNAINALNKTYNNERIFLWTGFSSFDILQTARLLYHLKAPCTNIFIIDFQNITITMSEGHIYYPQITRGIPWVYIDEVSKQYYQLTDEKLSEFVQLWDRMKSGNSLFRILDKNGQILEKEIDFYDSFIMSCCTTEYESAASIIGGKIMYYTPNDLNVYPPFIEWRLKQLHLQNKIETRGDMNDVSRYEVKLANCAKIN